MKKYLFFSLIVIIIGAVGYSTLSQISTSKVPGKLDRLSCHKNITSFERSYDTKNLNELKKLFYSGNYKLKSDIDKAQFMQSTLFSFINIKDTDQYLYNYINSKIKRERAYHSGLIIDYTIFENDIEDPKKKSDKCKLFRGYVVLKVKDNNNKLIYQVQIDFMDHKGKDIFKTLDCAIESFLTY